MNEKLRELLEEMREDMAIGDCFSAGQRLEEAIALLDEEPGTSDLCPTCGESAVDEYCGGMCYNCAMNLAAYEALYPEECEA